MSPTSSSPGVKTGLVVRDTGASIPLEHVHVDARVADLAARVTVRQAYRNREDGPIEVVFVHPVEEGAAVCGFEAVVDGVRFVGRVMERDEAFGRYDDAMETGDGAYLLDEERADVFTASLGNVKPGSQVVLSITYVTELAAEGHAGRFTLPTTVSPRYAPAEDREGVGPTPDDMLNPTVAVDVPYAFTFEMHVAMNGRVRSVTSPSHPIEVEHDGTTARVRLAQRSAPMDRDLVVVIVTDGLDVPHAVVERTEQGAAVMVSFVPRFEAGDQPAEVVFVVDRSGSMDGTSIEEVRNALQLCLRSLTPGCRFNIVSFGDRHSALFPESRPYDDASMREASAMVARLEADMGGTEMLPALESVLARPAAPGLPRQVLLLTDGEVTNTDAVIALARRHAASARFFTFGIGAGASQHLVRGIARASGGAAEFIAPGERIEAKVMRQFRRVLAPALTDVTVDWGQDAKSASDQAPPVFDGERLILYAMTDAPMAGVATLKAVLGGKPVSFEVPIDPSRALTGSTVATLAARARIRMLEEQEPYLEGRGSRQRRTRSRSSDATAEIVALGVRYQLCSRETSFVAIEHREAPVTEHAELRRVPVALTAGWGGLDRHERFERLARRMPADRMASQSMPQVMGEWADFRADDVTGSRPIERLEICRLEAAPAPSSSRRYSVSRTPAPRPARSLDELVALQAADGSWELTPAFAAFIGRDLDELLDFVGLASGDPAQVRRALATALAIVWLRLNAGRDHGEWAMLAEKAGRWLAACPASPAGCRQWTDVAEQVLQ